MRAALFCQPPGQIAADERRDRRIVRNTSIERDDVVLEPAPGDFGGHAGQKGVFARDGRPEISPPLLIISLGGSWIELAQCAVVVVELPAMVGQDRRDLRPLVAIDERWSA